MAIWIKPKWPFHYLGDLVIIFKKSHFLNRKKGKKELIGILLYHPYINSLHSNFTYWIETVISFSISIVTFLSIF